MVVVEDEVFSGSDTGFVTAVITGDATLEARSAAGTWIEVPDGAVTDTVFTFHAPVGSVWRFTSVTGTVMLFS
jgi:hypothetical protein